MYASEHGAFSDGSRRLLKESKGACLMFASEVDFSLTAPSVHTGSDRWAAHCFGSNSSFTDPLCNCLGIADPHAGLGDTQRKWLGDARPTIPIVVPNWSGGAIAAWLLKVVLEEVLGYPVQMDLYAYDSSEDETPVWRRLATGEYLLYPEVCTVHCACLCMCAMYMLAIGLAR